MPASTRNILIIISTNIARMQWAVQATQLSKLRILMGWRRAAHASQMPIPPRQCVPTRASIATGQYIHTIGNWDSASPYDGTARSWMHHLREHGIYTASSELHFRSADDNGFCEEILPMHVVGGWAGQLVYCALARQPMMRRQNWQQMSWAPAIQNMICRSQSSKRLATG